MPTAFPLSAAMKPRALFLLLGLILLPLALRAQSDALLTPPAEPIAAGSEVRLKLYLNNPVAAAATYDIPAELRATIASANDVKVVRAEVVGGGRRSLQISPMDFAVVEILLTVPTSARGIVSLRLDDPRTNIVMFSVAPSGIATTGGEEAAPQERPADVPPPNLPAAGGNLDLANEREELRRYISVYEPMYIAVGSRDGKNAKFQFSFKFRPFAATGNVHEWWRDLYLAYTQTSIWDLDSLSKPFYDTSYKPTVFYLRDDFGWKPEWLTRLGLQMGVQHESNGQAEPASRSLNTFYVTPIVGWNFGRDWKVLLAPRVVGYLEKSENSDIKRFRGHGEILFRFGQDRGAQVSALWRPGSGSQFGSGSLELDLSWPLNRTPGFSPALGGYVFLKWFTGYGESLRSFDQRFSDQIRAGFMLAR